VQLAGHLAPTPELKTQRRAALLAALLALVFLLIQPLLVVASYKAGVNLSISNRRQAAAIEERGNTLVDAVKTATTFGQVQSRMAALQGPPILDESSTIPLPTLKQELLKSINSSQAILIARSKESTSQVLPQIYRQAARSAILCLIGSLGFSLLAWDPVRKRNLVFSYLGSIGIGGLTPASLAKSLGEATTKLRNHLRRISSGATPESVNRSSSGSRRTRSGMPNAVNRNAASAWNASIVNADRALILSSDRESGWLTAGNSAAPSAAPRPVHR
jgi:hypothetical protein